MLMAPWVSKTGLSAQDMNLTTISNNLANVSTTGFKRDRAEFQDPLCQIRRQLAASRPRTASCLGPATGVPVRVVGTQKIFTLAACRPPSSRWTWRSTGARLLPGPVAGRHRVPHPRRQLPPELRRADRHLQRLRPEPRPWCPTRPRLTVGQDGTVSVTTTGNAPAAGDGNIQTADFINPAGLRRPSATTRSWKPAPAARPQVGTPVLNGLGTVAQNTLENPTSTWSRNCEHDHHPARLRDEPKVISTADQMLSLRHPGILTGPDRALAVRREVA